jgi:hypothetical protein
MNPGSKVGRLVLISAIVLFAISFFLPALGACEACSAPRGYYCAYFTFCYPWAGEGRRLFSSEPLEWFGFLFSGWINAAFLSALFFLQRNQTARFRIVRKILLLMLPACWIVFYKTHSNPSIGYFLWTAAMLTALFAESLSGRFGRSKREEQFSAPAR